MSRRKHGRSPWTCRRYLGDEHPKEGVLSSHDNGEGRRELQKGLETRLKTLKARMHIPK